MALILPDSMIEGYQVAHLELFNRRPYMAADTCIPIKGTKESGQLPPILIQHKLNKLTKV